MSIEQLQTDDEIFKEIKRIWHNWNYGEGATTEELKQLRLHLSHISQVVADGIANRIEEEESE